MIPYVIEIIFANTQCKSLCHMRFARVEELATSANQLRLHCLDKPCHDLKLHNTELNSNK